MIFVETVRIELTNEHKMRIYKPVAPEPDYLGQMSNVVVIM